MNRAAERLQAAWYRGAPWLVALRPLEWFFRLLVWVRRELYARGLFPRYRAPRPVVVVGNITVGGTGKTPVVIALVEALQALGLRPGVVSRGYGAAPGAYPRAVTGRGDPAVCGDEPVLIARRTGAPCVIDPDRPAAVRALLERFAVDIVISDDGLQHYALERDMEIAVVDAARGLGNHRCLPAGPLREPASRLATVDRVLYRGSDDPGHGVYYRPLAWVNLATGEERAPRDFCDNQPVHALAGIGQPRQFFAVLDALGIRFQRHAFPDHYRFSATDLAALAGRPVLMTEKDAVKCQTLAGEDAWYLRIDARLPQDLAPAVAALVAKPQNDKSRGERSD